MTSRPAVGSKVKVVWTDGSLWGATFKGTNSQLMYKVRTQTHSDYRTIHLSTWIYYQPVDIYPEQNVCVFVKLPCSNTYCRRIFITKKLQKPCDVFNILNV